MEIAPVLPPSTNSAAPPDRDLGRADDPLLALFAGLLAQAAAQGGTFPSDAPAQTPGPGAGPQQTPPAQVRALGTICQPGDAVGPDVPQTCPAFGREGQPLLALPAAGAERSTRPLAPSAPEEAQRTPQMSGIEDGFPAQPEAPLATARRTSPAPDARAAKDATAPPARVDAGFPHEDPPSTADEEESDQPQASLASDVAARPGSSAAGDPAGALGDTLAVPDQQPGLRPGEASASPRAEIAAAGGGRPEMTAASGAGTAFAPPATPEHPPVIALATPDPQGRQVTARLMVAEGGDGRRLRIELSPAELGRVEVSLRLDDRGNAAALFTVDRPETLQLLQRDARAVTELLATAGFSVDQGSLGFLLRDGAGDMGRPGQQAQPGPGSRPRPGLRAADGDHPLPPAAWSSRGLLDLRV